MLIDCDHKPLKSGSFCFFSINSVTGFRHFVRKFHLIFWRWHSWHFFSSYLQVWSKNVRFFCDRNVKYFNLASIWFLDLFLNNQKNKSIYTRCWLMNTHIKCWKWKGQMKIWCANIVPFAQKIMSADSLNQDVLHATITTIFLFYLNQIHFWLLVLTEW